MRAAVDMLKIWISTDPDQSHGSQKVDLGSGEITRCSRVSLAFVVLISFTECTALPVHAASTYLLRSSEQRNATSWRLCLSMAFICGAPVVTNRFSASKDVCGWSRGHAVVHRESRPTALGVVMIQLPWFNKKDAPKINLNFACGYAYLAHPEKNTGEDAFFIEANSIGVFDGVSGAFETRGVDPRLYSQKLAALTRQNVRRYGPALVVKAAVEASKANDEIGASTACVVGMDDAGRIFGVNLGDSGARIIRGGKMIFRTKEQQHFFNCPYQLGTDSEDGLTMGQNVQQKVRDGDWLIVASDGLYDNVPEREIVQRTAAATDPMQLAEELGEVASVNGVNKSFRSPFMEAAKKAGVIWQGGKADDITIITARILDNASIEPLTLLSTIPEAAQA